MTTTKSARQSHPQDYMCCKRQPPTRDTMETVKFATNAASTPRCARLDLTRQHGRWSQHHVKPLWHGRCGQVTGSTHRSWPQRLNYRTGLNTEPNRSLHSWVPLHVPGPLSNFLRRFVRHNDTLFRPADVRSPKDCEGASAIATHIVQDAGSGFIFGSRDTVS